MIGRLPLEITLKLTSFLSAISVEKKLRCLNRHYRDIIDQHWCIDTLVFPSRLIRLKLERVVDDGRPVHPWIKRSSKYMEITLPECWQKKFTPAKCHVYTTNAEPPTVLHGHDDYMEDNAPIWPPPPGYKLVGTFPRWLKTGIQAGKIRTVIWDPEGTTLVEGTPMSSAVVPGYIASKTKTGGALMRPQCLEDDRAIQFECPECRAKSNCRQIGFFRFLQLVLCREIWSGLERIIIRGCRGIDSVCPAKWGEWRLGGRDPHGSHAACWNDWLRDIIQDLPGFAGNPLVGQKCAEDTVPFLVFHPNLEFMDLSGDCGVRFLWAISGLRRLHFPRLTNLAIHPGRLIDTTWWHSSAWTELGTQYEEESAIVAGRASSDQMTVYWIDKALSKDSAFGELRAVPKFPAVEKLSLDGSYASGEDIPLIDRLLIHGARACLQKLNFRTLPEDPSTLVPIVVGSRLGTVTSAELKEISFVPSANIKILMASPETREGQLSPNRSSSAPKFPERDGSPTGTQRGQELALFPLLFPQWMVGDEIDFLNARGCRRKQDGFYIIPGVELLDLELGSETLQFLRSSRFPIVFPSAGSTGGDSSVAVSGDFPRHHPQEGSIYELEHLANEEGDEDEVDDHSSASSSGSQGTDGGGYEDHIPYVPDQSPTSLRRVSVTARSLEMMEDILKWVRTDGHPDLLRVDEWWFTLARKEPTVCRYCRFSSGSFE